MNEIWEEKNHNFNSSFRRRRRKNDDDPLNSSTHDENQNKWRRSSKEMKKNGSCSTSHGIELENDMIIISLPDILDGKKNGRNIREISKSKNDVSG